MNMKRDKQGKKKIILGEMTSRNGRAKAQEVGRK